MEANVGAAALCLEGHYWPVMVWITVIEWSNRLLGKVTTVELSMPRAAWFRRRCFTMGISRQLFGQRQTWIAALTLGGLASGAIGPAVAVTFDGSTHFAGVPRLVSTKTTQNQARTWGGRYYFTVSIPADASEPLGQLVIQQNEGSGRFGRFNLDNTVAFQADNNQVRFAIDSVELDREERSITISFEPGIEPGQTVQLGLQPQQTPSAGIYLFGVTAFPEGINPSGQFLGYGRLHFYDNDPGIFWR